MGFSRFSLLLNIVVLSSCYNSFDSNTTLTTETGVANITIGELHSLYDNQSLRLFTEEWSVRGKVTANDSGGNFYGSFVIEDSGYAIELLDGLSASHVRHPMGATTLIELKGLAMSRTRGVLQVGLPASDYSYYALDYLTSQALIDNYIYVEEYGSAISTLSFYVSELTEAMCGRVIRVMNLTPLYDDDELGMVVRWGGYRGFVSDSGEVIYSYVSSYADFAYDAISASRFCVTGVLQYSDSYTLKPRTVDDFEPI